MKATKLIIATMLALTCSVSSFAQKKEKEVKVEKEEKVTVKHNHGMMPGLDLTEDQQKKIKAIHLKTAKEVLPLKNQLGEKKARMRTLTTVDKPDMNEINKTIDEMTALKGEMMKKKVAAKMEVRSLLNEEQRLMFDMHDGKGGHKKMMKKMRKGHGKSEGWKDDDHD